MDWPLTRRGLLEATAATALAAVPRSGSAAGPRLTPPRPIDWIHGKLTGAQAVVAALQAEQVSCVFGIPGAQENELWDEFKARGLPYLLGTHEYGVACMADGAARVTGRPGVICVVPGPGITNALTGLGEALLDSSPLVAIVGDIAGGDKYRPFQVHSLSSVDLLKPVTKCVFSVDKVQQIPGTVRQAFRLACSGEPGPVAVVIPYPLFIEQTDFDCPPPAPLPLPFDEAAVQRAIALLADRRWRVGIYAGLGCMEAGSQLIAAAELMQAPVATSVSGKGCVPETHPLAVGWGFGPHASIVAEKIFQGERLRPLRTGVDLLLAIGVKFSEVSTGFYGNPRPKHVIHVDAHAENLGRVMPADVCVHADAGLFLSRLLTCAEAIRRPADTLMLKQIATAKAEQQQVLNQIPVNKCGFDPLALIAALRNQLPDDGMLFTDVSASEHLAAEYFTVNRPRCYFNPVDNQAMGWSLPAAIGAQRICPGRTVATLTGDGCLLMCVQDLSTAARECLPVKCFVLDDHAYHYMQILQQRAYRRTTATHLARLDYAAIAQGFGVAYQEIVPGDSLEASVRNALAYAGPVLIRVSTDYGDRPIRWVDAVRKRFIDELSPAQKVRFLARIGRRSIQPQVND